MKAITRLKMITAGHSDADVLWFEPGPSRCGNIEDGVVFQHNDEGGWLMSFKDLELAYQVALEIRRSQMPAAGAGEKKA